MLRPPRCLTLTLLLAAGCSGRGTCPEAYEAVDRDVQVGGLTPEALFEFVSAADQDIGLVWNDERATSLHATLTIGRDSGQAVNSPMCIDACFDQELVPVGACGPDWLITNAAGVLWTDDRMLDGEAMVGRALGVGTQWRLDLVPARGAGVQGTIEPFTLVDRPADLVEWALGATLIGDGPTLLLAEIRVKTRQALNGESTEQTHRLGITR
jgi:hypothetical protein